ncbi:MAG: helix-turn-helix domain-containing protein [SAR202 cluster bacterium]|nr:helix-turn-helix domain-containing protein [SAR202 cluster bacterium]|tara:strand:- start:1085 stop:1987 length:903 start_codon:yes stop_codon:yes gene_type:complete
MEQKVGGTLAMLVERYLIGVLSGDVQLVDDVVDDCYRSSQNVLDVYFRLISTAQQRIGEMWHEGEIGIAQEHLSTEIALNQMERLRARLPVAEMNGFSVTVTTVEGEHHFIGARMIADLLQSIGWEVHYLGPETPRHSLVEYVGKKNIDLVLLSFTRYEALLELQETIRLLRQSDSSLPIVVGGAASNSSEEQIRESGADVIADPIALMIHAREIVGDSFDDYSLNRHLEKIGERIQRMRKNNEWSQQELAENSRLDRTYISGLENGHQNLTLGALLKITNAFGVSIDSIISESFENYIE